MNALLKRVRDAKGQGMAEYALILALVSIVAIVTLTPLGNAIAAMFTAVTAAL